MNRISITILGITLILVTIVTIRHTFQISDLNKSVMTLTENIHTLNQQIDRPEKIWVSHTADRVNIQRKNKDGEVETVYYHRLAPLSYSHSEWIETK